ncbi:MAG TPA: hypothetical protein VIE65_02355 [Methylobacter sp.]|jgi:hypothetical protein
MKIATLLAMASRVAVGDSVFDSMEIGEAAGQVMSEGESSEAVLGRIKEALFGEEEIPSEKDFDHGFWIGFGKKFGDDLKTESREDIEELLIKPGKKALLELKQKLSGAGISLG